MKRFLLFIVLFFNALGVKGQSEQQYLVFTFNRTYECEGYQHGTADHVWIIPFDSCIDGIRENDMKPLFVDEFQLECLNDTTNYDSGIGEYPIVEYSRKDSIAWLLYKNRKSVQKRIIKTSYPRSKDVLHIYCVPIIAKCSTHEFGYERIPVVTIDEMPEIWDNFWNGRDSNLQRKILQHDFSDFEYIVSLKSPDKP